ncbi:unnamed protein product [Cuscuta epithymum]|uniref:Uncharacterized protein n=1 Tax=Cuscuta epithymum TaxID=186058 RepID=A0AAV0E9X8_9ASTE|nr:unnamed protein product [Cuscuta epithymum]
MYFVYKMRKTGGKCLKSSPWLIGATQAHQLQQKVYPVLFNLPIQSGMMKKTHQLASKCLVRSLKKKLEGSATRVGSRVRIPATAMRGYYAEKCIGPLQVPGIEPHSLSVRL